ncbi:hypothetical protein [Pseudomonas baetica]|uniref:hypothetical protein n=1 Tax=Pseudomonas baetica TaxID=674054 RepID=UPI0024067C11|nr:hypothetical protein [Pseudomonas baetica]MDF9778338.1 hypothetical protein [Pseudomonas baetica]
MQIMCLVNKLGKFLVGLLLGLGAVTCANAETVWLKNNDGQVHLQMGDGAVYEVKLFSDVGGVFYDRDNHTIGEGEYVSLFQVLSSNSARPSGVCGAGNEVWLHVYQVADAVLTEKIKVLVSSCLRSISLASQNTGGQMQDSDFSSVRWNLKGFSVEWFENFDAAGRPLQFTNFVLREGAFLPQDVLSQENPN